MTITISKEDTQLFLQNGFSESDVGNTVLHYRNEGFTDDEIQSKINERLIGWKNNNYVSTNSPIVQKSNMKPAEIYTAPKRNLITSLQEGFSWVTKVPMAAIYEGNKNIDIASAEWQDMNTRLLGKQGTNEARIEYLNSKGSQHTYNSENNYGIIENNFLVNDANTKLANLPNFLKHGYVETIKSMPIMWETIKSGGVGSAAGALGGAVIGSAITKTPAGAASGAKAGALWLGRTGSALKVAEIEGGLARNELREINKEIEAEGGEVLSDRELDLMAYAVGAVNGGLEVFSLEAMLKTVPGGKAVIDKLKNKELKNLVKDTAFRQMLKDYAKSIGTEGVTEAAQELSNVIAGESARKLGGIENTPLEQSVSRVLEAGAYGAISAVYLGGVGTTAKVTAIKVHEGMTKKQAQAEAESMTLEGRIEFIKENYDTLIDAAVENNDKVRQQEYEDDFYKKQIDAGVNQETAYSAAKLMGVFAKKFGGNIETFKNWYNKLEFVNNIPVEASTQAYNQAAMKRSEFSKFSDFYNDVVYNRQTRGNAGLQTSFTPLKNKQTKEKKQFNYLTGDGLNIRIPHDTVIHDYNRHKLTADEWQDLLDNIDDVSDAALSKQKSSYDGKSVLLKVNTQNNTYGVVLETFTKNNPLISTAFIDTEENIDNWIKNEAIPSGTKTTFSGIRLNSIISDIQPKFKSKTINRNTYFQSAYHGTPHRFNEFSIEHIGTGEGAQAHGWGLYFAGDKEISERYRKHLTNDDFDNPIIPVETFYNGEEITNAELALALEVFAKEGKEKAIQYIDKDIKVLRSNLSDLMAMGEDKEAEYYKENIKDLEKNKTFIKNADINKLSVAERKRAGQLYKVDIPEVDEMLDEDLTFNEQPQEVQEALRQILLDEKFSEYFEDFESPEEFVETEITDWELGFTGGNIYDRISKLLGSDKEASLLLNEYGIKGITYNGYEDGRCYVVFDDKAVKVLETYYQEKGTQESIPKPQSYDEMVENHNNKKEAAETKYYGYFAKSEEKNIIGIMKGSNPSTIIHEMGHLFLDGLNEMAKVDAAAREQLDAVNKWLNSSGNGYTVKQQEKFARSFEAYLYKGKAPNNKLRQVFENFREWMKSIYEHIAFIPEADLSKEAEEVFDRIFADDSYHEERKEMTKILRKIKSIGLNAHKGTVKQNNSLDDTQLRHKEVAYDILSAATGKSKKWLKSVLESSSKNKATKKKQETIQEALENVDDRISGGNGFLPEWLEFFADADLYKSDYELAQAAYDTIVNQSYKTYMDAYEFIDETAAQYDYIIKQFKNADENKRTALLGAFYEWVDGLNIQKDTYIEKFCYDTAEIERYENMDKFKQAKERILKAAAEIQESSISENQEYTETVKAIIKELRFLNPFDKARLTANILDVPNRSFLEARIDDILDIAKTMEDMHLKRDLISKITRELQGTKNVKKAGRTVGKYDYHNNKMFEQMRELDKLSAEKAHEMLLDMGKLADAEENGFSFAEKMINKFIKYKADGIQYSDTETIKSLYDDIIRIKLAAKNAKSELELMEQLDDTKAVKELVDILKTKKKANILIKFYNEALCNLESSLNTMFNGKIKEKYSMLYHGAMTTVWIENEKKKFKEGVAKIYGRQDWNWDNDLLRYLTPKETEEYTISRKTWDSEGNITKEILTPVELNRMHCILAYIWNKNETLHKRLVNMFGETQLENILGRLSKQDEQLGDFMQQMAGSYYEQINKVFIRKYGLDLPKVSCYFPSTPERTSEIDMLTDYSQKSLNRGFIKNRTTSERQIMDLHNPIEILFSHIDGAGKFINYSEVIDKTNRIFRNKEVESLIKHKYGKDGLRVLQQSLANVTYKSEARQYNWFTKLFNNVASNWILSNIAIRPIVAAKQLLSCTNYAVDMPVHEWAAGFVDAVLHPIQTKDYMMKIPYIKTRFESGGQNEALKEYLNSSLFAQTQTFKDWTSINVRFGDIGAIIYGGKPYIDYLIRNGKSEEEAIKKFIESTMRSQQSSDISSLSSLQVEWAKNPVGRLFVAYRNAPIQYIRMSADAIISCANGDMTKEQCAKTLFNFVVLQPFLYTIATSGSVLALMAGTGEWDDIVSDFWVSVLTGNAQGFSLLGDIYTYAVNTYILKEKRLPDSMPLLSDLQMEMLKLSKDDITLLDVANSFAEITSDITGFSINSAANMAGGVGDMFTGRPARGALRTFGMTKSRAGKISGEGVN